MLLHKRLCHFRALSRKSRPHTASAATNSTQFNVTMTSLRLRPRAIIKREILWFRQNLYQSLYIAIKNYTSFLRYHLFLIFLSPHYHSCLMPLVVMGKDNYALPFFPGNLSCQRPTHGDSPPRHERRSVPTPRAIIVAALLVASPTHLSSLPRSRPSVTSLPVSPNHHLSPCRPCCSLPLALHVSSCPLRCTHSPTARRIFLLNMKLV